MPTPVCIRPQARKRHPYRQTNSPPFDGAVALHLLAKANMNFYFGAEMCSVFPEDRGDQQDEYYSSHFTNEEIGTQRSSLTYTDAALVPPSLDWWYQDTWVSSTFCNEFTWWILGTSGSGLKGPEHLHPSSPTAGVSRQIGSPCHVRKRREGRLAKTMENGN
ncbi:uncharacterized protein LOC105086388 isoform X4 [Camelus dromedarius]|uniref:uncharacterized protein LOC105086388 isoform X4 n=1 Tax=Camelus dromedarius TaxID=9838 RepID=UPI00311A40D8